MNTMRNSSVFTDKKNIVKSVRRSIKNKSIASSVSDNTKLVQDKIQKKSELKKEILVLEEKIQRGNLLKKKLHTLANQKQLLEEEVNGIKDQKHQKDQEFLDVKKSIENSLIPLQEVIKEKLEKIALIKDQKQSLKIKLQGINRLNKDHTEKIHNQQNVFDQQMNAFEKDQNDYLNQMIDIKDLKKHLKKLEVDLEEILKEEQSFQSKLKIINENIKLSKNNVKEITQENRKSQIQLSRLENQLQIIKQEISIKEIWLEELQNEIKILKETQNQNQKFKQEKDSQLENQKEKEKEINEIAFDLSNQNRQLEKENQLLKLEINNKQFSYQKVDNQYNKLNEQKQLCEQGYNDLHLFHQRLKQIIKEQRENSDIIKILDNNSQKVKRHCTDLENKTSQAENFLLWLEQIEQAGI